MAPTGYTRTTPSARARSRMARVMPAWSLTGSVFGIAHTAVKPPAAAARVPVAIVSLSSRPGSRRCAWRSMKPGQTTRPLRSSTWAPRVATLAPISATTPPSRRMSRTSSTFRLGVDDAAALQDQPIAHAAAPPLPPSSR